MLCCSAGQLKFLRGKNLKFQNIIFYFPCHITTTLAVLAEANQMMVHQGYSLFINTSINMLTHFLTQLKTFETVDFSNSVLLCPYMTVLSLYSTVSQVLLILAKITTSTKRQSQCGQNSLADSGSHH